MVLQDPTREERTASELIIHIKNFKNSVEGGKESTSRPQSPFTLLLVVDMEAIKMEITG